MWRSIKTKFAVCAFVLSVICPIAVHAAAGIDTTTSDLPFSISGTQVMSLTSGGLNVVRGNLTLTGCVLTGSGGFTSTNCPFTVANGRLTSNNNQGDWASVFTGNNLGMYAKASGWAGYFDGPVMMTSPTTLNSTTTVNGALYANGGINVSNNTSIGVGNGQIAVTQNQSNWTAWFQGNTGLGLYAHGTTWAGYFDGPVNVNGNLCLNGDCRTTWPSATNTTQYINGGCPGGSVMTGVSNGTPICAAAPTTYVNASCPSGQVLTGIVNNTPVCAAASSGLHNCRIAAAQSPNNNSQSTGDARCNSNEVAVSASGTASAIWPDSDLQGWTGSSICSSTITYSGPNSAHPTTTTSCTRATIYAVCCAKQ